jgi:hypothetical protein
MNNLRTGVSRFGHEYCLQVKLLTCRWSYLVMHVVYAVVLVLLFGFRSDKSAEGMLVLSVGTVSAGLTMLVTILVSGIAASRASQEHFLEMTQTLPTGVEIPVAGILASSTAGLGLLLEPIILAATVGPFQSLLDGLFPFCWFILISALLGSAFTWWLASWLKFRRWVYPLLAAAWAGFFMGPAFLKGFNIPGIQLIDLYNRMQNTDYDSLFGRLEDPSIGLWFCLFFVCLALIFASLTIFHHLRQRFPAHVVYGWGLIGLTVCLSVCVAVQFYHSIDRRQVDAITNQLPLPGMPVLSGGQITSYDVRMDLTASPQPVIQTVFVLHNDGSDAGDTFTLALNHHFQILSSNVPYDHEGDKLTLKFPSGVKPGGDVQVDLKYQGEFTSYYQPETPIKTQFLSRNLVRLGLSSMWLPIAGKENGAVASTGGLLPVPAAMSFRVKAPDGVKVYCNLTPSGSGAYQSPRSDWLYVLASPRLVSQQIGKVEVYSSYADVKQAQEYGYLLNDLYDPMKAFFPKSKAGNVTALVLDQNFAVPVSFTSITDNRPILVSQRIMIAYQSDILSYGSGSASELFTDFYLLSGGGNATNISLDTIGRFVGEYIKYGGDVNSIRAQVKEAAPLNTELLQIVERSGRNGLQQVVDLLPKIPASTADDDASTAAWLKERVNVH